MKPEQEREKDVFGRRNVRMNKEPKKGVKQKSPNLKHLLTSEALSVKSNTEWIHKQN